MHRIAIAVNIQYYMATYHYWSIRGRIN